MEKVYFIQGWNGDQWEDSYEWVEAIHKTKEGAEKHLYELTAKAEKDYEEDPLFSKREYHIEEKELMG